MSFNFKKPFIIAEIGNNHEGNFHNANKLILKASECGVDAVKFQTFIPELYTNLIDKKRIKRLKKFQLTNEEFFNLSKNAKSKNLKFISTPLDLKSAIFLNKIVDYFKISSGDNNYYELIDKVLSFKKKTIISTGLLDKKNLDNFMNYLLKKKISKDKLAILHCVSSYPTKIQHVNLKRIEYIKKKYNVKTGFSDHSIGLSASIKSLFYGAEIIEKHFTLKNNFSSFRDHKLSLNPKDMKLMVNLIDEIYQLKNNFSEKLSKDEKNNTKEMRRSNYWACDLRKGEIISQKNIKYVRPFNKLSLHKTKEIIGGTVKKDCHINTPIKKNDITLKPRQWKL